MLNPRLLMLMLPLLIGCSANSDVRETRFMMGTLVEFTISGVEKNKAESAIQAAAVEMQRIDNLFTIYGDAHNPIKRLNNTEVGNPLPLPEEVARLLRTAMRIQSESAGSFDPFLGKLDLLWGFSLPDPPTSPPDAEAIRQAIPPIRCLTEVDAGWIRQNERCAIDLGAIAKGYAIDRGIAALKLKGIQNAIINAGGDLRILGRHGNNPWHIGIRDPRKPGGVIATLSLQGDTSIVTSGDYERYFIVEGHRYHHILNPRDGWPATGSRSATVIAPSATLADAWSTALFVSGAQGMPTIQKIGLSALLVTGDGDILATDSMRKLAKFTGQ